MAQSEFFLMRIDPERRQQLRALAERAGRSQADYVRTLIDAASRLRLAPPSTSSKEQANANRSS